MDGHVSGNAELSNQLVEITIQLRRIASALERQAGVKPTGPDFQRTLAEYPGFDWSSIGAGVVASDADGPTAVQYDGFQWLRRSPQNKYDPVIFYSRACGKDENGETAYLRLITFKQAPEVDPVGRKTREAVETNRPAPQAPKPAPAPAPAQRPAPQAPAPKASQPQIVTQADYLKAATSPRYNIIAAGALRIAQAVGMTDEGGDYSKVLPFLPYFAEAKAVGVKLETAISILSNLEMDHQKALMQIRRLTPATVR